MERTTADQFRANMREWMEMAESKPIKITRKSGEAFVLMNADLFEKMQLDLASARGIAAGLSDVIQGRVHPGTAESTKAAMERGKARAIKMIKAKKGAG